MEYFYTKAHHALCAMIDHGMRLDAEHHRTKARNEIDAAWLAMHICNMNRGMPAAHIQFFVRPESLQLLEPQIGDAIFSRHFNTIRFIWDENEKTVVQDAFKAGYRGIIQRNGLPFPWPETTQPKENKL